MRQLQAQVTLKHSNIFRALLSFLFALIAAEMDPSDPKKKVQDERVLSNYVGAREETAMPSSKMIFIRAF